jgi:hypothetical protein
MYKDTPGLKHMLPQELSERAAFAQVGNCEQGLLAGRPTYQECGQHQLNPSGDQRRQR